MGNLRKEGSIVMEFILSIIYILGVLLSFLSFTMAGEDQWNDVLITFFNDTERHWLKSIDRDILVAFMFIFSCLWPLELLLLVISAISNRKS